MPLGDFDAMFLKGSGDSLHRHALIQKIFNNLKCRPHDQRRVVLLGLFDFFAKDGVDFGTDAVHDLHTDRAQVMGLTGDSTVRMTSESIMQLVSDRRSDRHLKSPTATPVTCSTPAARPKQTFKLDEPGEYDRRQKAAKAVIELAIPWRIHVPVTTHD